MTRSPNRNKATGHSPSGDELPKQDPVPRKPAADQPVFGVPCAKLQYAAAATSGQDNAVAMALRAPLAQSDISTKLTIQAGSHAGQFRFATANPSRGRLEA